MKRTKKIHAEPVKLDLEKEAAAYQCRLTEPLSKYFRGMPRKLTVALQYDAGYNLFVMRIVLDLGPFIYVKFYEMLSLSDLPSPDSVATRLAAMAFLKES